MYTNLLFKTKALVNPQDYCEQTDSFANETGAKYQTIGLFIDSNGKPFTKQIDGMFDVVAYIPYIEQSKFDIIVSRMTHEYETRTHI